jgi:hypothetical protein
MQEFDLYSLWLNADDTVGSQYEDTISALSSTDAVRKFFKYSAEKLRMGKLSTFYYTEQSANAAIILKQHQFVNLITVHVPPMQIDVKPVPPLDTDMEFEIIRDGDEEAQEEHFDEEEHLDEETDEGGDELPADIIETTGDASDQLSPIPDECDLMTLQEFIDSVKDGLFVDYDGHGRYANGMMMSPELIYPSDVIKGVVLEGWTHVAWFNK